MNNSDRKLQLIKKIVDADDAFLKRLDDFINIGENRLEIVEEFNKFDNDEWNLFAKIYLKKIKPQMKLYGLISEERKLLSSNIETQQREAIEIMLIIGKLLENNYDRKTITNYIRSIKEYDDSSIKNRIKEANKIYLFIQKNVIAKAMLFHNAIANSSLYRYIIEKEYDCKTSIEDYLYKLLSEMDYKINENKIVCPKKKNGKDAQLTKSIIEKFNQQNPRFGMPVELK